MILAQSRAASPCWMCSRLPELLCAQGWLLGLGLCPWTLGPRGLDWDLAHLPGSRVTLSRSPSLSVFQFAGLSGKARQGLLSGIVS